MGEGGHYVTVITLDSNHATVLGIHLPQILLADFKFSCETLVGQQPKLPCVLHW